jgi:hypothetical protein
MGVESEGEINISQMNERKLIDEELINQEAEIELGQTTDISAEQVHQQHQKKLKEAFHSKETFQAGWKDCDDVRLLLEVATKSGVSKNFIEWGLFKAAEEAASTDLYLAQFVKRIEKFHFGTGSAEEIQQIQEMIPEVINTAKRCKENGRLYGWYIYWVALLAVKDIIDLPEEQLSTIEFQSLPDSEEDKEILKDVSSAFKEQLDIADIYKGTWGE